VIARSAGAAVDEAMPSPADRPVGPAATNAGGPEQVLVVPRSALISGGGWRGVRTEELERVLETIARRGRFEPRTVVESDPRWKQVIPYLVVRDGPRYFLMQRTSGGADARLHDLWSIGVGGHVNPGDGGIMGGLRREWREEIKARFEPAARLVGLLNDDTTEVGRVHLGIVFVADAGSRPVAIRETSKLRGAFATAGQVRAVADRLETWSQLIFEQLDGPAQRSVRL
jgi:predicted NUDIX family phosphoesterase